MTNLRIMLSSAAYDNDQVYVVADSRPVRRALKLRQRIIDETGDGSQNVEETDDPATIGISEFVETILVDVSDGYNDGENREWVYET